MDITLYFFFNLSLLIIIQFFSILLIGISKKQQSFKVPAILFSILSIIICFAFTYQVHEKILMNLYFVPLSVGGLYVGIGPFLGLLAIILSGIYGFDIGFFSTVIVVAISALLIWKISPWFLKRSAKQRIAIVTGMTLIAGIITPVIMQINQIQIPFLVFDVYFAYLVIQPLGAAMIAFIIEITCNTVHLRHHLVKSERLEIVEKMAAAISHEIRNPLTAAIGFVQLMQDESISKDKSDQYLSIINSELNSAEKVIQNFLTISQPQIEIVEPLNVNKELQFAIDILHPSANRNNVQIEINKSDLYWIHGDRQSFHQCFVNIIKNSIEAMENGGTITIEIGSVSENVNIRIHDTGKGMTPEQVERLGEPYYSTKGESGTGLGIMVAYNIVRAMKGTIFVKSEVGIGTTFEFYFPKVISDGPPE
ncbi:HAMP domain-containing histidine kinase [Bacillus sp. FJAT-49711]|uniref:sensor histidine kinase n=1 Tax=Bacillus sp. FJAT-49711 TaxID=2833585 RepID=UPI001BC98489|nr:HAMP domain-containing sensor histidine kinase [Bacillus sp. FJAT-49711]MBS4216805.1 HAMP domain-containing histidine kinase [Bacillus sp. FJAT-49711]